MHHSEPRSSSPGEGGESLVCYWAGDGTLGDEAASRSACHKDIAMWTLGSLLTQEATARRFTILDIKDCRNTMKDFEARFSCFAIELWLWAHPNYQQGRKENLQGNCQGNAGPAATSGPLLDSASQSAGDCPIRQVSKCPCGLGTAVGAVFWCQWAVSSQCLWNHQVVNSVYAAFWPQGQKQHGTSCPCGEGFRV